MLKLLERDYWARYRLDEFRWQEIANLTVLLLIHMNPIKAGRILQTAINACGQNIIKVKVDGVIGSKTIDALGMLAPRWFSDRLRLEACRYYLKEADKDANQRRFFRGWIRRALR